MSNQNQYYFIFYHIINYVNVCIKHNAKWPFVLLTTLCLHSISTFYSLFNIINMFTEKKISFLFILLMSRSVSETPCENEPCHNGGICIQEGELFTCDCPLSYSGSKCEGKMIFWENVNISICVTVNFFGALRGSCFNRSIKQSDFAMVIHCMWIANAICV